MLRLSSLLSLCLAAALPAAAGAVDIGDLEALYAQRAAMLKGDQPPVTPEELIAACERFKASGELAAAIGAPKSAGDPRLSPRLKQLVAAQRVKGDSVLPQTLKTLAAPVSANAVPLELLAVSASNAARLLELARNHGGDGLLAEATHTVLVTVPSNRLETFLDAAQADYIDLQTQYEPNFGPTTGEGGAMMQVRALHDAGVKGQGVMVAVLDGGFMGYSELVRAGELPKARAIQVFDNSPFESVTVHGSACAEVIADIAPAAEQVLMKSDLSDQSLHEALRWLRTQKDVAVVNASWGNALDRIDGLSAVDQEIDRFVKDTGVVWVNAAGNEAERVWTGPAVDRDGNKLIEITYDDGKSNEFLIVKAQGPYSIGIQWDDWGDSVGPTATQDLDASLYVKQGKKCIVWQVSNELQDGHNYPREFLAGASLPGGSALLKIKKKRVDRDLRVRVAVSRGVELTPHSPPYSLISPASARQALAVGGVDVRSRKLADYSSNGPSWDQRLKPEVSAPTEVVSQAYRLENEDRFSGTSAAAPHVTGLAALLASTGDHPRGAALRAAVERYAQPMGQPQPNNAYGRGLVVAQPVAGGPPERTESQSAGDASGRVRQKIEDLLKK